MVQYLKKAEAELEKPPSTSGQELAKKDYTAKKVCCFNSCTVY